MFDELEKISADNGRKEKVKRWLKDTALITGAAGVGAGVSMLAEEAAKKAFGPDWANRIPVSRRGMVIGAGSFASGLAAKKFLEERRRRQEEEKRKA
jgi:hypothetical protein